MDERVHEWWLLLCGLAVANALLWVVCARRFRLKVIDDPSLASRGSHVALSLVYVVVCGFRGVLPRADVQRICVADTYLSSIAVGRSVATVAELACVIQWAILTRELGRAVGSTVVTGLGRCMVALIVVAEICSWYAVLTTNYLGNTIEESCWTATAALVFAASRLAARRNAPAPWRNYLLGAQIGSSAYVAFMLVADVRMYWLRWLADTAAHKRYLSIAEGWADINRRWVVTGSWADWSSEVPWMTLYFSAAVWVMVLLAHLPALPQTAPAPLGRVKFHV